MDSSLTKLLFDAVRANDASQVIELIKRGVNIHASNDYCFIHSSINGYLEIVKVLVENGANVHIYNERAIRWAALNNHYHVFKYLYRHRTKDINLDEFNLPDDFKEELENLGNNKVYNLL